MSKNSKIGWIGVGRMGYQMAERLAKAGYDISIWNRTKSKAEPLAKSGAKVADNLTDLAGCDIVKTCATGGGGTDKEEPDIRNMTQEEIDAIVDEAHAFHKLAAVHCFTPNGQRMALAMKVGTPVYEHLYLGKFFPYSRPSQYPYPVVAGGMLAGAAATRFSETTHDFYPRGSGNARGKLRTPGGWIDMHCHPWGNNYLTGILSTGNDVYQLRDTETQYPLLPVLLHDNAANLYGELDGIYHVSGFNNAVENTLSVDGKNYVVMQSVARTGHTDYYALRLDA